jgi:Pretoxin HINT domain
VPVDRTITKTVIVSYIDITEAFWKNLAYGMVSDFIGCARGKLTDCAWAAATLLAPAALKVAARSVIALRVALRSGVGIMEALEALRAADLGATAEIKLEEAVERALNGKCFAIPHSFESRTLVVMADGSLKPISRIKVGDRVRTTDPVTGRDVIGTVTRLLRNYDSDLADVSVRDRRGHVGVLHTTDHHRLWDDTRHTWTEAADLLVGTRLHTPSGAYATVAAVRSAAGARDMYDLTVADVHTYYVVAGKVPVLAHNASCIEYVNFYGGNEGGVLAKLDEGGVASFAIEKGPTTPNGAQMFDDAMAHFGADNVNAIEGKWVTAMPSNLNTFNTLTAAGASAEDAAAQTFTGKMAARYGFLRVEIKSLVGSPGSYTNVEVLFTK